MVKFEVYARRIVLTVLMPFVYALEFVHDIICSMVNNYDLAIIRCWEDLEKIRKNEI
jgi:hypothetical protein